MKLGAVFPQLNIGADRGAIRDYGTAVDELGFDHLVAFDHVVGADPSVHVGWAEAYDYRTTFHEPFVLFGYLAGLCPSLEFATGVIILPQRQSALVAKQAAEVDILSGGRFRLGVGIGWNAVEYEALGERFDNRGRRLEEQIALLRRLWTEQSVTFEGSLPPRHRRGAGSAALATSDPRVDWRLGDRRARTRRTHRATAGSPTRRRVPELDASLATVREAARAAGRQPDDVGVEGRISVGDGDLDRITEEFAQWELVGASHVSFNTMGAGLKDVDAHVDKLRSALEVVRS